MIVNSLLLFTLWLFLVCLRLKQRVSRDGLALNPLNADREVSRFFIFAFIAILTHSEPA